MNKNKLSISDFSQYLSNHGWIMAFELEYSVTWRKFQRGEFIGEITLPKENTRVKDSSIDFALMRLSEIENIPKEKLHSAIINQHSDNLFIRVVDDSVKNGTIPLSDGVLLFEKAQGLIRALAQSTRHKQAYFKTSSGGKNVSEFMNQVRLGQTQIGSYIINLCYPVENIVSAQQTELTKSISFSRSVTHNLFNSLDKLKSTIKNYNDNPTLFAKLIPEGVSHNLCAALVGLSGENKQREVEITLNAGEIEDSSMDTSSFSISFTPSEIDVVSIAAKYYQGEYILSKYDVIGKITELHSREPTQGGYIIIPCKVERKSVEVRIDLNAEQYKLANKYHTEEKEVICKGKDLHINKKSGRLQKLLEFNHL